MLCLLPRHPTHLKTACRAIYKYALDHLPKSQAGELYRRFVQFEKQQGDREGIEVCARRCRRGRCAAGCRASCELARRPCMPRPAAHPALTTLARPCLPSTPTPQEVIVSERRFRYEEEVRSRPLNYDAWFDYIRLEEGAGDIDRTREVRAGSGGRC